MIESQFSEAPGSKCFVLFDGVFALGGGRLPAVLSPDFFDRLEGSRGSLLGN